MPKRIVDGDALWRSDKLAQVTPNWIKAEYANLLPLAFANGSFECSPRLIWSRVYAYNREEITVEKVAAILSEFERVRLLFRWLANGKPWGFWVGIDKPGRLPPPSRKGSHEITGESPDVVELEAFLLSGKPVVSQPVANGCMGLGLGLGLGLGKTNVEPPKNGGSTTLAPFVQKVFDYYIAKTGRNDVTYTLLPERMKMGVARLKECIPMTTSETPEDGARLMMGCVDKILKDPFSMGQNDRNRKYRDWEHLFDSATRMQKWLNQ